MKITHQMQDTESRHSVKIDLYLLAVLVVAAVYIFFWVSAANYLYATFSDSYFDMGQFPHASYIHLYYPYASAGLESLVFGSHISPFGIFLELVFALWTSPISFIAMQEIFLAMAGILIYFIGKEILRSRFVGFAMAIAFFFNGGILGTLVFNIHLEGFIPFFYILAFYLYMKERGLGFIISYALMLGIMESVPVIGLSLIIGLLFYEFAHYKKSATFDKQLHRKRLILLAACLAITLVFYLFYSYVTSTLLQEYASGAYPSISPDLKLVDFLNLQVGALLNFQSVPYNPAAYTLVIIGIGILLFSFGITSFVDPILFVILLGPWLGEIFILRNPEFANFVVQYYSYAIGGALVAAVLGMKILMDLRKDDGIILRSIFRRVGNLAAAILPASFIVSGIAFIVVLLAAPYLIFGFVYMPYGLPASYTQAISAISSIPQNSTVMAQANIYPHMYDILNLELPPDSYVVVFNPKGDTKINLTYYWFRPQYIVIDRNSSDFNGMDNSTFSIYQYMGDNYSTYYNSSDGFAIYKLDKS